MNIKELKEIINSSLPEEIIKSYIINSIAKDENAIPTIMLILERERKFKKQISDEMNLLLSKAHTGLDNRKLNDGNFMQKEIMKTFIPILTKVIN